MRSVYSCAQAAFEQALRDGLHCAVENVHVRELIEQETMKQKEAATQMRTQTMSGEWQKRAGRV